MKELAVIIPVYNEEEAIGAVLDKWTKELDKLGIDYTINPYNDGSKDGSWNVIMAKEKQYPGRIVGHNKSNSGHGPTILQGYRDAAQAGYEWIFQVDSDDEMGPEGFAELWRNRDRYDFLVGIRDGRKQALPRKIISAISRLSVRMFYGQSIWDVNTPYRLMRVSAFCNVFQEIPSKTFAPNVILSGMAAKLKLRYFETRVPQHDRTTGEVSIKKWKLFKAAMKSFFQTVFFAMAQKPGTLSILLLSSLVAFLFVIKLASFRQMITGVLYADTDSSVFLTIAREMLQGGRLPYRDLFDHKGVYIYFLNIIALLTNLALLEWFFFFITSWILYRTLLLVVRPRTALLFMFIWPVFLLKHSILGYGNQTEIYILPAIAYAIYYPISLIKRNGTVNHLHTLLLGMSFGWILMLKFNYVSLYAAPGFILLWMLCRQRKWKDLSLSVVIGLTGIIAAILPGILYLWKYDILSDFYNIYIVFNFKYASSRMLFSNFLRMFKCWPLDNQPNNLVRLIILFPWLTILIFCVKNEHCGKDDKNVLGFILATFLLNAPTWLGRVYVYYFITLTLPALLAYAFVFKYTIKLVNDFIYKIQKRLHPFIWTTTRNCLLLFIGIMFLLKASAFLKEMKHPHIPVWKKDAPLCELLDQNDRRMLVVGSLCFAYYFYNAKPDCRYLYQCPISNVTPVIWEELLKEIQIKATPIILVQEENLKNIPEYFMAFLHKNYKQMDCLQGLLFVLPPLKKQI
jgi:glycosyltransferase involved in cell wall biosynthesis